MQTQPVTHASLLFYLLSSRVFTARTGSWFLEAQKAPPSFCFEKKNLNLCGQSGFCREKHVWDRFV